MKLKLMNRFTTVGVMALLSFFGMAGNSVSALDIAPMTWTPRSDWINVQSAPYNAKGDGVTDDTAAIQAALDFVNNNYQNPQAKTVYFPPGKLVGGVYQPYKITGTLHMGNIGGYNLIGCGLNTTIKWAGPAGGAMMHQDGGTNFRSVGFVWDGGGTGGINGTGGASCAYWEYSSTGVYMTAIRHENESFRNFTVTGTYLTDSNFPNGFPPAAIISGFNSLAQPVGEVTIFNCCFKNCTTAIHNAVDIVNNFMWVIDGCEFENNGVGFDGGSGFCYVLMNSHFQQSSVADIQATAGWIRGERLTSSGSAQFFTASTNNQSFQDCWIDGWTDPNGAMELAYTGTASVADCTFTNPPVGTLGPIFTVGGTGMVLELILSNIIAPAFPSGTGLLHEYDEPPVVDWVPAGSMGGNLKSATQTFLQSAAISDGAHIIDVTKAPYNVLSDSQMGADVNNTGPDATAGIQAAINAAKTANNGSVVYIPGGYYKISSTLAATGGNYTIEGEGLVSELCWTGGSNGTIMTVSSPQSVTVRQLDLAAADNLPGESYYWSAYPTTNSATVTGLKETSTVASKSVVYDNLICSGFRINNPGAPWPNSNSPGLVMSSLPAGSTVYIPVMSSPLTVTDCGPAQIFSKMAYMGAVNVSGATQPKTGFLGLAVAEGGQNNPSLYNFTVNDNQNLLVGAFYSEQQANDISLLRGAGTTPGRVAIQGPQSTPTPVGVTVNVNNYAGRLFYGGAVLTGGNGANTVQIEQTGSNPIDMMFACDTFAQSPTFDVGTSANLITTLNQGGSGFLTDEPDPLTAANLNSLAASLDDFRQLGALNLAVEYGIVNPSGLVAYWKLDDIVSPSADSSMSGITGTWENGPTFSTATPSSIPYADAGSMTFNGTNQYINMGNPAALPSGTQARTICGWAKSNSTASEWRIIASFGTNAAGEAMFIGEDGTAIGGGGFTSNLTGSGTGFGDNNWHFVALTYDGTTAKLYGDGVLLTSAPETWNLVHSGCVIGEHIGGGYLWNGSIDDVRIYNYALSATQIANLFSQNHGQVVNVQFTDGDPVNPGSAGEELDGSFWSASVSPLAYVETTWTADDGFGPITETNLPYSDGTPSTVGYTLTSSGSFGCATNGVSPLTMFTETEYGYSGANLILTINGLQNGQAYDLYLPAAFDGNGSTIKVGTQTQTTTGVASGSTFVSGVNFVKFIGIKPVNGSIVVTVTPNNTGFSILNGFQITAEVP